MPRLHPRPWLVAATLLVSGCAGTTARVDPAETALGDLPGRWENAFVDVKSGDGELRIHYLAAGPKDAPRVILLHGFPDFAYTWRRLIPALAGEYRVLAPDLRGYAATAKPKRGYDLDTLSADLLAFADATARVDEAPEGIATHLVGHDWGAAIGWWAVMEAPQRFASYTALSVPHPQAFADTMERSAEQRKRSRYFKTIVLPGVPTLFASMRDKKRAALYRGELAHPDRFSDTDLVWYRTAFDTLKETRPPIRYYKERRRHATANEARAREAAKITIPVLVLWGEQDKHLMWPMAAESCAHVEPGKCHTHVFRDAGHWPHWDAPEGVLTEWRAFIAGRPAGESAGEGGTKAPEAEAAPTEDAAEPTPSAP
ncbi:MAG: alpha/beta hydrolase [Nannocystaceae bacterium]